MRIQFVLPLLFAGSSTALAQDVPWAKSWAEALDEAKARNVPILYTVHGDN